MNISYLMCAVFSEVYDLERFQTTEMTFMFTQGHPYLHHMIDPV